MTDIDVEIEFDDDDLSSSGTQQSKEMNRLKSISEPSKKLKSILISPQSKNLHWWWILPGLALLCLSLIVIWQSNWFGNSKDAIYLAVSGPMTGSSKVNGLAMVDGIQMYLMEVNQQGGIDGKPVKLLIFDDQNKPELAAKNALEIATNTDALAVIGHYTSSASLAAAPIYKEHGIPAVTGSATADEITKGNDWYFRVIFNNSDQGALMANYVQKVLNYDKASILFDEDAYGATLATAFANTAKKIGLSVPYQWSFNTPNQFKTSLGKLIKTFATSPDETGILFLATHSNEAVKAITELRSIGRKVPTIGADALSSSNFLQKLSQFPQERTQPGYYSNGIYTTAPFLFDIAAERAQNFRHAYVKKYLTEPTITSSMYYDAAMVVIDGIKKTFAQKNTTTTLPIRKQVMNNLWQLSKLENALEGVTGYIYFDENGDAIKSIPIGVYKNGRAIVAMQQYQPFAQLRSVENLLQEVLDNRIIQVNGKFMSKAQVVYVGIDINDISELNLQDSTFTADFYFWFRFQGDFDDNNLEFINVFNPKDNNLGKPILERKSSIVAGVTTRTYRLKIPLKVDFDFRNYPLDVQLLPIYFRHNKLTRDKLIYVVDIQGIDVDKLYKDGQNIFSVGGWKINKVAFFQSTQKNDSTLGLLELFGEQQRIEYSRFNAAITINRYLFNFLLKNLLPTFFLIILGYFAFFIPPSSFGTRLSLGTNMIVATSLFHIKLASDLPKIDYIILLEYFFFLVYFLAVFIIGTATIIHLKLENDNEITRDFIKNLDIFSKVFYPLVLLTFVGVVAYLYGGM